MKVWVGVVVHFKIICPCASTIFYFIPLWHKVVPKILSKVKNLNWNCSQAKLLIWSLRFVNIVHDLPIRLPADLPSSKKEKKRKSVTELFKKIKFLLYYKLTEMTHASLKRLQFSYYQRCVLVQKMWSLVKDRLYTTRCIERCVPQQINKTNRWN